jgi:hypothetical protein
MTPPQGLVVSGSNMVCKLNKSLDGLKQATRMWFKKLSSFLRKMNFIQSLYDKSLFIRHTAHSYILILVYVDDSLICGDNATDIAALKTLMNTHSQLKDLGELRYFLGLEITESKLGISISQSKYTLDLLENVGLLAGKLVLTPTGKGAMKVNKASIPFADAIADRLESFRISIPQDPI